MIIRQNWSISIAVLLLRYAIYLCAAILPLFHMHYPIERTETFLSNCRIVRE